MRKAGLSQEIVAAKINASECQFDTSPEALKTLKTSNVPDAVILAMIQARGVSATPQVQQAATVEVSTPTAAD